MNQHLCNKKEAASFFRVSVQALDGWFSAGCPVQERNDQGRIVWLCLEDMVAWRIDRAESTSSLDTARIRLTKAQADKTELEVAELRGDLISTPKALIQVEAMVGAMRAKLLSLPVKAAAKVAKTPADLAAAQEAIRTEVYEALDEIASDRFQDEIQKRIDRRRAGSQGPTEADDQPVGGRKPPAKRRKQRGTWPVEN